MVLYYLQTSPGHILLGLIAEDGSGEGYFECGVDVRLVGVM